MVYECFSCEFFPFFIFTLFYLCFKSNFPQTPWISWLRTWLCFISQGISWSPIGEVFCDTWIPYLIKFWCFNREFFCCWPLCSCWVMGATQSELCFGHLPWTWKPLMKGNNSKIFSKDPEWIKNIIERNIVCRWLLKDCFIEHEELDWIFKTHEKLIKYLPAWQNKVNCDIQKLSS